MSIIFDGVDDAIKFNTVNNNLNTFTWYIVTNFNATTDASRLINKGSTVVGYKFLACQNVTPANSLYGFVRCDTTIAETTTIANSISTGSWSKYVMTYDNSGDRKVHIWKDGLEMSYNTQVAGVGTITDDSTGDFRLGSLGIDGLLPLDGKQTEFAMWNVILTSDEIYNLSKSNVKRMPLQIRPGSLKGYWPLDEYPQGTVITASSGQIIDRSNNNLNGLAFGSPIAIAEEVLTYQ